MPAPTSVRFSVRWTGSKRRLLIAWTAFFGLITAGWLFVTWNPAFTRDAGEQGQLAQLWVARSMVVIFVAATLLMLGGVRHAIWLDGGTLVRQGALWRRRIPLSAATFDQTETTWYYARRLGPITLVKVKITAPTLVVRAARAKRIKLLLAHRSDHEIVGGRVRVAWLPQPELDALADAIDRHATAPNRDAVASYLRNVARAPFQPRGELGRIG